MAVSNLKLLKSESSYITLLQRIDNLLIINNLNSNNFHNFIKKIDFFSAVQSEI
jgi:hypothetical protein